MQDLLMKQFSLIENMKEASRVMILGETEMDGHY